MPGIAGIFSRGHAEKYQRLVRTMVQSMEHEPFYTSGTYVLPELGVYAGWVAHENSFAAEQVFFNEQRDVALMLSGECYIDREKPTDLRQHGHTFGGNKGDYLVHCYEEDGVRFFEKLNGLFSGLLIDQKQKKVFLFNDRYGYERVYWHQTDEATYFASEAKALLCVLPELRRFDDEGVAQFLNFDCTFDGRTLFRNIQFLPGGSLWSFESGQCRKRKYFSPETWESQPVLPSQAFTEKFEETFQRVLPRYYASDSTIGISLTGGLDSRMIMACRPQSAQNIVSYTFSGQRGETFDDRLAARVAETCGVDHRLLRLGSDFFSDYGSNVDRTVYVTDGCFGATGAHEIYFNKLARELAPVRLTGNWGSEVLRGSSTFKPLGLSRALFNPEFKQSLDCAPGLPDNGSTNPITFAAFREIPWSLFGSVAAARSKITSRTPYLDNEIVALAYQAPEHLRTSPLPAWHLIKRNNTLLGSMPTDRRPSPASSPPVAILRRFFSEATFKLDYLNNEGWPNWLSPFEPVFTRVTSTLNVVGLHKYLHYRSWFRHDLAKYVTEVITDPFVRRMPFWNRAFMTTMAQDHVSGRKNYVSEINAVLTLEAVERLFFRNPVGEGRSENEGIPAAVSTAGRCNDALSQIIGAQ